MNPQEDRLFFFFGGVAAAMSSLQVTSQQPCHRFESPASSHVMPTWVCAMAGIYGCGIQESAHLNMKPDIAYRCIVGVCSIAIKKHLFFQF